MRICIFGLGAVGGHFATRLAAAGHDVSAVARGETLSKVKADGLTLTSFGETIRARVNVSEHPADLGPQDAVISTLKATQLASLAEGVAPLLGPETQVVFAQNGIPWWYDIGLSPARPAPPELSNLDPGGALRDGIEAERIVGAVIQSPNEMVAPGVVVHESETRNALILGRPDDRADPGLDRLRDALVGAGIQSPPTADIRQAIWGKLFLNMSISVLCLVTGHRAIVVNEDERLGRLFVAMAREGMAAAAAHGINAGAFDPESFRPRAPDHMPSIRQDFERGRPVELENLLLAPIAFARVAGIATPNLEAVAALAVRQAIDAGLFPA